MGVETVFQTALFARMTGDAPLMAVATEVVDVPTHLAGSTLTAVFPYIRIGALIATNMDSKTRNAWSVLVRLHTWSQAGSMIECRSVQGLIYDALQHLPLSLAGFNNYYLAREEADSDVESDTRLIHGVCDYRALISKT